MAGEGIGVLEGDDRPVSLAQVALAVGVALPTVYGWVRRGSLPRGGGPRVQLATTKIGGRLFTSPRQLRQFLETLNAAPVRSEAQREADYVVAVAELEAAGY